MPEGRWCRSLWGPDNCAGRDDWDRYGNRLPNFQRLPLLLYKQYVRFLAKTDQIQMKSSFSRIKGRVKNRSIQISNSSSFPCNFSTSLRGAEVSFVRLAFSWPINYIGRARLNFKMAAIQGKVQVWMLASIRERSRVNSVAVLLGPQPRTIPSIYSVWSYCYFWYTQDSSIVCSC